MTSKRWKNARVRAETDALIVQRQQAMGPRTTKDDVIRAALEGKLARLHPVDELTADLEELGNHRRYAVTDETRDVVAVFCAALRAALRTGGVRSLRVTLSRFVREAYDPPATGQISVEA